MADTNTSPVTFFDKLVIQARRPANGLIELFKSGPSNIFNGDDVEFDIVQYLRTLPKAKDKDGAFDTINTKKYKNRKFSPPAYKERVNYNIGQTNRRQAGRTIYDNSLDKTALLASQTANDTALLLSRIEMGMLLQAAEILQYGKIRFKSVYGYPADDIDFSCPAALFADVATTWATASTDGIADIEAHIAKIEGEGYARVDNLIFGTNALNKFLAQTRTLAELDSRRLDKGNFTYGEVQLNGFQRVGVYNFKGVNVAIWTFDEFYQTKDANDVVNAVVPFVNPNFVLFYSSQGDYQRYFAGIDTIKDVPESLKAFLSSPNITIFGDNTATDFYLDTKYVSDGTTEGVYLRAQSRPLLVPRTNNTFGRLNVIP